MTEQIHDILIPVPESLRDNMLREIEKVGSEVVNQRIINALKFAFTDNPIPFTDESDENTVWATKGDIEAVLEKLEEVSEHLHNKIIDVCVF